MVVAATIMVPRVLGLLDLNDGRDKVTVSAAYGITYDSNLFAHAGSEGDTDQTLTLGTSYNRRAGLISVDATASVIAGRFAKNSAQDFTNPSLSLELDKTKGRLSLHAFRSTRKPQRCFRQPLRQLMALCLRPPTPLSDQRPLLFHKPERLQFARLPAEQSSL